MDAMPSLPIDASRQIAAAYRCRPPRYPVIPETAGVAIVLLVNRNTSLRRPLDRPGNGTAKADDALCGPAETFATALTGDQRGQASRGGALASIRTLTGRALLGDPCRLWMDHEPACDAVRAYLADWAYPAPAIDALVADFQEDAAPLLASCGCLYERPADTRQVRAALLGQTSHAEHRP